MVFEERRRLVDDVENAHTASGRYFGQTLVVVFRHQIFDQLIQVAFHDGGQVLDGEVDAVVGDTVLGEVVGADFFAAVARADLVAAGGGHPGLLFFLLVGEKPGAKNAEGFGLVLQLGTFVGAANDETAGLVVDLDGAVRRVDALTAGTAGAADGDFHVLGFELDIDFLSFRQHRDAGGAGVDAALRFGFRHALDAVNATLVTHLFVDVLT